MIRVEQQTVFSFDARTDARTELETEFCIFQAHVGFVDEGQYIAELQVSADDHEVRMTFNIMPFGGDEGDDEPEPADFEILSVCPVDGVGTREMMENLQKGIDYIARIMKARFKVEIVD